MNTLNLVEKENQFRKEFEIFNYKNLGNPSKVLHRLNRDGVTISKVGVQTGIRNVS